MSLHIQIRHLRAYEAIMQLGTVSAAAELLNLTQPAVSRLLATLETELGFKLFYRRGRRLVPSIEGRELYKEIEGTLTGIHEISSIAEDIRLLKRGRLRIAAIGPLSFSKLLPSALTAFSKKNPQVRFSLEHRQRFEIDEWVASRQVDLGFTLFPVDHPSLNIEPIITVAAIAAVHKEHEKASKKFLTPDHFEGEQVILTKWNTRLRQMLDASLLGSKFRPSIKTETSSALTSCHLAAEIKGICISDPFSFTGVPGDSLRAVRWKPELRMVYGAIWPKDREPTNQALEFIQTMRASAKKIIRNIPEAKVTKS